MRDDAILVTVVKLCSSVDANLVNSIQEVLSEM